MGKTKLGLDEDGKREYIEFAKKFKQLYRKDFASDDLTSILLRKTFVRRNIALIKILV